MKRLSILLLTFSCNQIFGQSIPGPTDPNEFSNLNNKRNELIAEIPSLEQQVANIYLPDMENLKFQMQNLKNNNIFFQKEADRLKATKPTDTAISSYEYSIRNNENFISQLRSDSLKYVENSKLKDSLSNLLHVKKLALSDIENKINQLMIPKISQQNFLFWSSIAFVLLMGLLLGTFFYVVSRDNVIRRTIFGTDSGIQFITLFSIVIAIIIFGLTNILEGKELSALLGSVAGYILGKVKLSNSPPSNNPPAGGAQNQQTQM